MSKKYLQILEVEVIHFTENNINEVLDFICDGEDFGMCFEDTREDVISVIKFSQKINIENPSGIITCRYGDYLVKNPMKIFEVWGSNEEFEKYHKKITYTMNDLNAAIEHCENKINELCGECKEEHKKLLEMLTDLKNKRECQEEINEDNKWR